VRCSENLLLLNIYKNNDALLFKKFFELKFIFEYGILLDLYFNHKKKIIFKMKHA